MIKRGDRFTHDRFIDLQSPLSAEDAPKAKMQVTRISEATIWYNYEGQVGGGWRMPRSEFVQRFGEQCEASRKS